jgi:MFS transporter, DHA2 family, multidrug resistance protein
MTPKASIPGNPRAGRREWIGLAVLALPTVLISLDASVLYLALPRIGTDLGADGTQQLWILDIYSFVLAGLLVTMGTLGDRVGRRKLLLIGAACFGFASVVAAFSRSPEMLIAARALLGVAGATLGPSTMALIRNMFKDPTQMGTAIGVWFAAFMAGAAIGPLVGGALLESFGWGAAFLLGVPFMVGLLILGPRYLPEYRDPDAGRLDFASVGLLLATILPVTYGLKDVARNGPSASALAAMVAGIALGVVFVRRQRNLDNPLLDLNLFAIRAFSASLGAFLLLGIVMAGISLVASFYLQLVAGLSPLSAGLWLVPQTVGMAGGYIVAPRLARRFGRTAMMALGMAIGGVGILLFTQVRSSDGIELLVTGLVLASTGISLPMALMTGIVLGSAPPEKAGAAASLNETSAVAGIALGIAALGSLATFVYRVQLTSNMPASVPAAAATIAKGSIAAAVATVQHLPATAGTDLLDAARAAFTAGLNTVGAIGGVIFLGLAVLVAVAFRHGSAATVPTDEPEATTQQALRPALG